MTQSGMLRSTDNRGSRTLGPDPNTAAILPHLQRRHAALDGAPHARVDGLALGLVGGVQAGRVDRVQKPAARQRGLAGAWAHLLETATRQIGGSVCPGAVQQTMKLDVMSCDTAA